MQRLVALVVGLLLCSCTHGTARHGLFPFLVAERSGQCGDSKISVFPDGQIEQVTEEVCSRVHASRRALRLSREGVEYLQSSLVETQFFTLPTSIHPESVVLHEPTFSITAWHAGQEHSVSAFGLERMTPGVHAHRFLLLWAAIQESVATAGQ